MLISIWLAAAAEAAAADRDASSEMLNTRSLKNLNLDVCILYCSLTYLCTSFVRSTFYCVYLILSFFLLYSVL